MARIPNAKECWNCGQSRKRDIEICPKCQMTDYDEYLLSDDQNLDSNIKHAASLPYNTEEIEEAASLGININADEYVHNGKVVSNPFAEHFEDYEDKIYNHGQY